MVKIWTGVYYTKRLGIKPESVEYQFDLCVQAIGDIMNTPGYEEHAENIKTLIHIIEGTDYIDGGVISKFVTGTLISVHKLSTGCKTALVIYCYLLLGKSGYINLTEAGPIALFECLKLLDGASNLTGIVCAPLNMAGNHAEFDLMVNDEPAKNWIRVAAITAREVNR